MQRVYEENEQGKVSKRIITPISGPGPRHLGSSLVQTWFCQDQDWILDSLFQAVICQVVTYPSRFIREPQLLKA